MNGELYPCVISRANTSVTNVSVKLPYLRGSVGPDNGSVMLTLSSGHLTAGEDKGKVGSNHHGGVNRALYTNKNLEGEPTTAER